MNVFESIMRALQEFVDEPESDKNSKNAEYLASIGKGIKQLENGKGKEHELIEEYEEAYAKWIKSGKKTYPIVEVMKELE